MRATIWTKPNCSFCVLAKKLFEQNNIEFEEREVNDESIFEFVESFPGVKTVPQITLDDQVIGGYSDLVEKLKSTEESK